MKQLPMTSELAALIQKAVGTDVDPQKLTVFETIALNTKPLPGKRGTIFENAVVEPITLVQMVDHINAGNHLPLVADHELFGAPKGRAFHAGVNYDEDGALELRVLFYLDETEAETIAKLNSGSLDEVSVAFLSTQFLCSECGWDYIESGTPENLFTRTCGNGHEIGEDEGVHARLVGLSSFLELSVVARGAADNPKIVGKSESKLAPTSGLRLAAKGFEPNAWVVHASMGKETMDTTKLVADLTAATSEVAVLKHEKTTLTAQLATATETIAARDASITALTAERDAAQAAKPEGYDETVAEHGAAVAALQSQVNALLVATNQPKLEGDAMPSKVAELTAKITELTSNLTAILPAPGGVSQAAGAGGEGGEKPVLVASVFTARKN